MDSGELLATSLPLLGMWTSTEAFGNTSLDWTRAIKERNARLMVEFRSNGSYSFRLLALVVDGTDVTNNYRHLVPADGKYSVKNSQLFIEGDSSGIMWTFQPEEDNTLRIRLEGAKRFGRCKGVDVIYFKRVNDANQHIG